MSSRYKELMNTLPDDYAICDHSCGEVTNPSAEACLAYNIHLIVMFGALLLFCLYNLYIGYRAGAGFGKMKTWIFIFGGACSFVRVVRGIFLQAKGQTCGEGCYYFDQTIHNLAFGFIMSLYSVLLLFWSHLCRKKNTKVTWIGRYTKKILIGVNIAFYILIAVLIATSLFPTAELISNGLIGGVSLIFIIMYLVEGSKVYHLIKSSTSTKDKIWIITRILILVSVVGLTGVLVNIITSIFVMGVDVKPHEECMATLFSFRYRGIPTRNKSSETTRASSAIEFDKASTSELSDSK